MKVVIAFTVLLLAASGFELVEDFTDKELMAQVAEDMKDLAERFTIYDSTELVRGDWEVVGIPYVIAGLHKTRAKKYAHRGCIKYL